MDNCNCNSLKKPTCKTAAGLTIVIIPAQSGDSEGLFAPKVGDYKNTLVKYMADSKVFLYDKDGNWTLVGTSIVPGVTLDTELSLGSTNGVQNKVITKAINDTNGRIDAAGNDLIAETDNRVNADITLQGNIDAEALARGNADNTLQGNIDAEALARANAITGVENKINQNFLADLVMTADADNVTFTEQKINPNTGVTSAEQDIIPAASATTAGTISAAEYQTLKDSEELLEAILEGAAAVTGIPATPTQTELTDAWLLATGNPQLINRASIYDVDNELIWTYYTNTSEWYSAVSSITLDPFTNSTAGTIKGSTTAGNVSANADGTGTVAGWATLVSDVSGKADASSLATVATTGAYSDLTGTPTLATVATSGDYADLTNKPTIPTITMTTVDPGAGSALAADNFIAVYEP